MGEKFATLILKVDLECCQCYKKIRKVLCKLQDREKIRSITYDEKNNVVIISGPFDPHMLSKKLCCKACKVIKDIEIKEAKPEKPKPADPPPPPAEEPKPKPAPPPPEPKPAPPPPEPKPAPPPPGPAPPAPAPKPAPPPPEPAPPKAKPEAWPCEPACACRCCSRPCYVGYYGGCRCSSCGMVFGWSSNEFPPPVLMYGRPTPHCQAPKTCQFFCEEDPSCSIM